MLIDFDLLSYLIGFVLLGVILIIMRVTFHHSKVYLLFFSIFFFYILNVSKYTLFPIEVGTSFTEELKETTTIASNLNLVPFRYQLLEQTLFNILLTTPFGFGLSFIKEKINFKAIAIYGLCFVLLIETLQLVISIIIGYAYRVIDINDVLANFIGVILGYLCFLFFSKIFLNVMIKYIPSKMKKSSFINYIRSVCRNDVSKKKGS